MTCDSFWNKRYRSRFSHFCYSYVLKEEKFSFICYIIMTIVAPTIGRTEAKLISMGNYKYTSSWASYISFFNAESVSATYELLCKNGSHVSLQLLCFVEKGFTS